MPLRITSKFLEANVVFRNFGGSKTVLLFRTSRSIWKISRWKGTLYYAHILCEFEYILHSIGAKQNYNSQQAVNENSLKLLSSFIENMRTEKRNPSKTTLKFYLKPTSDRENKRNDFLSLYNAFFVRTLSNDLSVILIVFFFQILQHPWSRSK